MTEQTLRDYLAEQTDGRVKDYESIFKDILAPLDEIEGFVSAISNELRGVKESEKVTDDFWLYTDHSAESVSGFIREYFSLLGYEERKPDWVQGAFLFERDNSRSLISYTPSEFGHIVSMKISKYTPLEELAQE